eukprot:1161685-Pelagomonas_calceolata.AAC.22
MIVLSNEIQRNRRCYAVCYWQYPVWQFQTNGAHCIDTQRASQCIDAMLLSFQSIDAMILLPQSIDAEGLLRCSDLGCELQAWQGDVFVSGLRVARKCACQQCAQQEE